MEQWKVRTQHQNGRDPFVVSACSLLLDDIELTSQKRFVPKSFSALFQESDRIEILDSESEDHLIQYRASRCSVLKRLDLMGCTGTLAQRCFVSWREEEIRKQESYLEWADSGETEEEDGTLKALRALCWNEWRRRVPRVIGTVYGSASCLDETDRHMKREGEPPWLWFDGFDSLITLRAIIDAAVETEIISLDVGPLISAEWIDQNAKICERRPRIVLTRGQAAGPTIILAEGKSDIAVLRAAARRMYPELDEYISFLDHSEFQVDGGASYVVKFLKAFAAARIPANIVAIFDNDGVGLAELSRTKSLNLPDNIACIRLPDIQLGHTYPTIGREGSHNANINGRACGIELYLGRASLTSKNGLRPVRWTAYDNAGHAHQGKIEEKEAVQEAFLTAMRSGRGDVVREYPEMVLVWREILNAAVRVAEAAQQKAAAAPDW